MMCLAKKKVIQLLKCCCSDAVFIVCWSPFFLYNLLELFEAIPQNDPLSTFIQSAAPLNSAANPIIYGIFSTRICRNLRYVYTVS